MTTINSRLYRLALVSVALFVSAVSWVISTNAYATGTTGDFGKRLDMGTSLHHFQVDKHKYIGQRFDFECPAVHVRDQAHTLYGTGVYPASSPLCVAARHAGAIGHDGGPITVQLNPGADEYVASKQNDIESSALPKTNLSIMFLTPDTQAYLDDVQSKWVPRLKWKDKFSQTGLANIRLTGQYFEFDCPTAPDNLAGRRVYGTDSYPLNALVCLSAVHAGQISKAGGRVRILMNPALDGKFVGSTRNGIESKNGSKSPRSITFPGGGSQVSGTSTSFTKDEVGVSIEVSKAGKRLGALFKK